MSAMAEPTCATMDFTRLEISNPVSGARGNKSAAIVDSNGQRVVWRLPPMRPAFEPSAYGGETDAARLTLNFRVPAEIEPDVASLDEWIVQYCAEHSQRLFGKPLSGDQIAAMYNSPVKRHERYGTSLRCKYVASGLGKTRFWDAEGKSRGVPESWKASDITPRLRVASLWWVGKEFGVTMTLDDALVHVPDAEPECPF